MTGKTDLRLTEVQQPNITATLSTVRRPRAFSANSGQLEAGSTTTASSFLPNTPPLAFCCSINISIVSLRVVSEIAMVPESECKMPILIVSPSANAGFIKAAPTAEAERPANRERLEMFIMFVVSCLGSEPEEDQQTPCHFLM